VSLPYRMSLKRSTFTNRTNTPSTELSSITHESNPEEENSNRKQSINIIKHNNYYKTNDSNKLLNNERNSTTCIIQ